MAKVTIILEDETSPDGDEGLIVEWKSDDDFNTESLAHSYAHGFIQQIIGASAVADIIDKDTAEITPIKKKNDPDPTWN